MKKLSLGVFAVCLLLSGCMSVDSIRNKLEDRTSEMMYVHDSEKVQQKKSGTVQIGSFIVDNILPEEMSVRRMSSAVYPFIFVNIWKQELQSGLGYSQIKNDYKQFMKDHLIEELKRSCQFGYGEHGGNFVLDVYVKKVEMAAPIYQRGNFLFLVVAVAAGTMTAAGPVDVDIQADVKLKNGEAEVWKKELHGKYKTNILSGKNVALQDYTTAMIEGLSMAVKDLNEKIVNDVNQL